MKCPIHNQEMLIRNEGGEDHYIYIAFECPHPECHHWWVGIKQRDLVEGWRKKPTKMEDDYPRNKPKREMVLPEGYRTTLTAEERSAYLKAPRKISHYTEGQGDLFEDKIKETEQ